MRGRKLLNFAKRASLHLAENGHDLLRGVSRGERRDDFVAYEIFSMASPVRVMDLARY
jgi:hypothetical protein